MRKLAAPLLLLVASYLLFFSYLFATYGALPLKVASHFDLHGNPNGWMSRQGCAEIETLLVLIVPGIVIGTMAGAGHIPVSFINLPHRDYWLAPERCQSALAVLLRYSIWFAALNVLLLTGLQWLTVQANLQGGAHLDMRVFGVLMAFYLGGTILWTVRLLRNFSKIR